MISELFSNLNNSLKQCRGPVSFLPLSGESRAGFQRWGPNGAEGLPRGRFQGSGAPWCCEHVPDCRHGLRRPRMENLCAPQRLQAKRGVAVLYAHSSQTHPSSAIARPRATWTALRSAGSAHFACQRSALLMGQVTKMPSFLTASL